jgi:large subunit ribosomal protein L35
MKQKSHSGAKKRVKITGTGKMIVRKSCKNHLLVNKSKGQKKLHKKGKPVEATLVKALRKMIA